MESKSSAGQTSISVKVSDNSPSYTVCWDKACMGNVSKTCIIRECPPNLCVWWVEGGPVRDFQGNANLILLIKFETNCVMIDLPSLAMQNIMLP